jgi:hypothetical protein
MTLKTWLVGVGLAAVVGVAGCGHATRTQYRAGCCPPTAVGYAPATTVAAAPAPCCNGQQPIVAPVPSIRY